MQGELKISSLPEGYWANIAAFEIWHTHAYDRYIPLKEGMMVVDAGASVGYFSIYAAKKVGNSGKVLAFEPEPISYSHLVKNVSDSPNIVTENIGLYNENKTAKMYYQGPTPSVSWYMLFNMPKSSNDKTIDIPLKRLDSVLPKYGISHVDFLKIDTEGAEYKILEGLGDMLWDVDNIAMEEHSVYDKSIESPQKLQQLLERYGFRVKRTIHYGFMPYMYATRDPTVQFPLVETWQILTVAGVAGLVAWQVMKK